MPYSAYELAFKAIQVVIQTDLFGNREDFLVIDPYEPGLRSGATIPATGAFKRQSVAVPNLSVFS